jgi:hypothetical protein
MFKTQKKKTPPSGGVKKFTLKCQSVESQATKWGVWQQAIHGVTYSCGQNELDGITRFCTLHIRCSAHTGLDPGSILFEVIEIEVRNTVGISNYR